MSAKDKRPGTWPEEVLDTYHLELERRIYRLTRERDELQARVDRAVGEFIVNPDGTVFCQIGADELLAILQPKPESTAFTSDVAR
jgi:hypothetical protein